MNMEDEENEDETWKTVWNDELDVNPQSSAVPSSEDASFVTRNICDQFYFIHSLKALKL